MSHVDERDLALGALYATAMWAVAEQQDLTSTLLDEVHDLSTYLEKHPEFGTFLSSPTVDTNARANVIEKLFRGKYSDVFVNTVQVLNAKDRLSYFPAVAESYRLLHEERSGRVEVFVQTAHPLNEALRNQLRDVASKRTGLVADLVERVDDSLIGGMVVQIADDKFDMSVSTQLARVFRRLLDRASQEIHSGRRYLEGAPA
jgi:F-type H+-transporting ATPase subunit delta